MKDYLVLGAKTIQSAPVRIVLKVTKIKDLHIRIVDANLAYLQSNKPFIRRVLISSTAPKIKLSPKECLGLFKSIYSSADSEMTDMEP